MSRSKSSRRWLDEHFSDPFVKKAQKEGVRSRAAYKLEEMLKKDKLLKPGMVVVDLGAAPGGWSQLVRNYLGDTGRVIAMDILEMPSIAGVEFIHGDFSDDQAFLALKQLVGDDAVDLVLSDIAPNMSGVRAVDQPRMMGLAEMVADFAAEHLKPGGSLLIKLFHGEGFDDYIRQLRQDYRSVKVRKPEASRARSREVYALAKDKK